MKCFKVVRKYRDRLTSAIVYKEPTFRREYGMEKLVDMGMVFKNIRRAIAYKKLSTQLNEVWEAECSYMQPIHEIADPENRTMKRFWDREPLGGWQLMPAPKGTYIAFDIVLKHKLQ